jgi:hypothetical protein
LYICVATYSLNRGGIIGSLVYICNVALFYDDIYEIIL